MLLAFLKTIVYITQAFCASRQDNSIPRALMILKGAVPDLIRGFRHMAPTYFVGS